MKAELIMPSPCVELLGLDYECPFASANRPGLEACQVQPAHRGKALCATDKRCVGLARSRAPSGFATLRTGFGWPPPESLSGSDRSAVEVCQRLHEQVASGSCASSASAQWQQHRCTTLVRPPRWLRPYAPPAGRSGCLTSGAWSFSKLVPSAYPADLAARHDGLRGEHAWLCRDRRPKGVRVSVPSYTAPADCPPRRLRDAAASDLAGCFGRHALFLGDSHMRQTFLGVELQLSAAGLLERRHVGKMYKAHRSRVGPNGEPVGSLIGMREHEIDAELSGGTHLVFQYMGVDDTSPVLCGLFGKCAPGSGRGSGDGSGGCASRGLPAGARALARFLTRNGTRPFGAVVLGLGAAHCAATEYSRTLHNGSGLTDFVDLLVGRGSGRAVGRGGGPRGAVGPPVVVLEGRVPPRDELDRGGCEELRQLEGRGPCYGRPSAREHAREDERRAVLDRERVAEADPTAWRFTHLDVGELYSRVDRAQIGSEFADYQHQCLPGLPDVRADLLWTSLCRARAR